jgi:hypothetical protein
MTCVSGYEGGGRGGAHVHGCKDLAISRSFHGALREQRIRTVSRNLTMCTDAARGDGLGESELAVGLDICGHDKVAGRVVGDNYMNDLVSLDDRCLRG